MVDVSEKKITKRTAHAQSIVELPTKIAQLFQNGDINTPKGPVFSTAIIAGTMACKRTSELIPFCHPLSLESCKINIKMNPHNSNQVIIDCIVTIHHKTGVEMEALTGCSVAALTIYDMCKALSHDIIIKETKLIKKTGGKSNI